MAFVPAVGDADKVRFGLVPRDYVIDAMDALSVMDKSVGRTYALTDPNPPTARQLVDVFAEHLGKKVVWVPLPLGLTHAVVGGVPGLEGLLGLPAEGLDYFAYRTVHTTDQRGRRPRGDRGRLPAVRRLRRHAAGLHDRPSRVRLVRDDLSHPDPPPPCTRSTTHLEHTVTTDKPAVIVNVSLAGSDRDYDQHVTFLDSEFHLRRIGTNGDVAAAEELVRKWADDADVIAVTGIREARVAGLYDGDLEAVEQGQARHPDDPGHRRARPARRAAGVVDPPRADRRCPATSPTPASWCSAA